MAEAVKKADKPGFFKRIAKFFRDMKGEVKKVVWPSRKQVLNHTLVVIGFVVLAAIIIGGLDILLHFATGFLFPA